MKICDAHTHLGPSGPWQPYSDPSITAEQLIKLLNQNNVERAIVFPNPNVGDEYPKMNDYIAQSVARYPDRLVGFGRVDPRRDDATEELDRIRSKLRLTGLKLHPFVECFRPDHPSFDRFFKKADELSLPILFHTGDGFSSPGLIARIASKYPRQTIILGHLREGCLGVMKECQNAYVETSGTLPDLIELAVNIDENRILFGSDIPYYRYHTQTSVVEAADISQEVKRKIFHDNFQRMLTQK